MKEGEGGGQTECEGCCAREIGQYLAGWLGRRAHCTDTALQYRRRYDMESRFT